MAPRKPGSEVWERMLRERPGLQAEVDRLAPRYAVIRQFIKARLDRRMSQRDLAERAGVSQPVINRFESGAQSPSIDRLATLAEALGYRLDVKLVRKRRERTQA